MKQKANMHVVQWISTYYTQEIFQIFAVHVGLTERYISCAIL